MSAKPLHAAIREVFPDLSRRKGMRAGRVSKPLNDPKGKLGRLLTRKLKRQPQNKSGKVTLVGAGPGDAELLTLKAVRALQSADIILFDKLVSDDVLELARLEARRMLVGKRGGQASCRQSDINDLMVKLAKQGKHVVRLKSGDPMIFGRAGEEITILENENIEVEVVPGVTAALAIASRLSVSLTHRDCAQSVKFITAHSRKGQLPDLDWAACADQATTLMIYMGARTAPQLVAKLIENGMPADMPVLIAKGISRATEEVSYHRLANLLDTEILREQPVLLGIGHVFEQRCAEYENAHIENMKTGDLRVLVG